MSNNDRILEGHSDLEKGAYLGAIASIATADRLASPEEIEHLSELCDAAELSDEQKETVIHAATEISGGELTQCLDILKSSDLKYSLVADLLAFAKSDGQYDEAEQRSVDKIAQYLNVDKKQFSILNEFAEKTTQSETTPEQAARPNFLSSLGLSEKMQNAGINGSTLLKGLLGIAGPMILGRMINRGLNRGGSSFGRGGGLFGGSAVGGLGSLIGMLSGGRGMRSNGGLLGRILGR